MMLKVIKNHNGTELKVSLVGRLDTMTARVLEQEMKDETDGIKLLTMDFTGLDYISSAGLQILLKLHRRMNDNGGKLQIRNASKDVRDIFDITGFSTFLNVL